VLDEELVDEELLDDDEEVVPLDDEEVLLLDEDAPPAPPPDDVAPPAPPAPPPPEVLLTGHVSGQRAARHCISASTAWLSPQDAGSFRQPRHIPSLTQACASEQQLASMQEVQATRKPSTPQLRPLPVVPPSSPPPSPPAPWIGDDVAQEAARPPRMSKEGTTTTRRPRITPRSAARTAPCPPRCRAARAAAGLALE
jgi:hypothetical protein